MSPELALVDPDVARRARESLQPVDSISPPRAREKAAPPQEQKPTGDARDATAPTLRERLVAAGADPDLEPTPRAPDQLDAREVAGAERSRPRRLRRRAVVVVAMAGLAGLGAATAASLGLLPDDSAALQARVGLGTADETSLVTKGAAGRARTATMPPRQRKPATAPRRKDRKPPRSAISPTRTFVWPSVANASAYRVEFFTRGRKVFEASPTRARLELPQRWTYKGRRFRLTRGTYHWRVRPVFGHPPERVGKLITRSNWVVR